MKSASTGANIDLLPRINYLYKLYQIRIRSSNELQLIPWEDFNEYERVLGKFTSSAKLIDHNVLEIGYGARPWRLFALASMGVAIQGIDLDRPIYGFHLKRLVESLQYNGFERFLKSSIRGFLFDRKDLKQLQQELAAKGKKLIIDESRMVVGNAVEQHYFKPHTFSFVYSEDVFEHIPAEDIPAVLENIKTWLKPGGIFFVRPNVWTGISGGHDPDFYPDEIYANRAPQEKAWSHLLDPEFKVNTFLNRLRLSDYIHLFSSQFDIVEIKQKHERLGENYLNDTLLEKLSTNYTKEELLTNQISFGLRA